VLLRPQCPECDCRCRGDIQGVDIGSHRDAHDRIADGASLGTDARSLGSEDQRKPVRNGCGVLLDFD
jgi:hypothetical protein